MDRKGSCRFRKDNLTRECRNFYERRLRTMEKMKQSPDWCFVSSNSTSSCCSSAATTPTSATSSSDECCSNSSSAESDTSCQSSVVDRNDTPSRFEKAVTHLKREIATLISQDNDLFRQLLALNDSIEELKEQRRGILCDSYDDDDEEDEISRTGSFESLCESELMANQTSSPTSTLSSTSSTDVRPLMILPKNFIRNGVSIPPSKTNKRTNSTSSAKTVPVIRCDVIRPSSLMFKTQTIPATKATSNLGFGTAPRSGYLPTGFRPFHTSQGSFDSGFNGSYSESEVEIFV